MIPFTRGTGVSMASPKEFTKTNTNRIWDIFDYNGPVVEPKDGLSIKYNDDYLFDKLEQIINSYDYTEISVSNGYIIANVKGFKINNDPSKNKYQHIYTLYWFIRTCLIRDSK